MEELLFVGGFIGLLLVLILPMVSVVLQCLQGRRQKDLQARVKGMERELRWVRTLLQEESWKAKSEAPASEVTSVKSVSVQPQRGIEQQIVKNEATLATVDSSKETVEKAQVVTENQLNLAAQKRSQVSAQVAQTSFKAQQASAKAAVVDGATKVEKHAESEVVKEPGLLQKCWNWLLYGAVERPQNTSLEYAVATTWLPRLGIIILVLGLGLSLKYSIDHNLVSPTVRMVACALTGLGLIVGGLKCQGTKYQILGLALAGGGFATLYFAVFAAAMMYQLISVNVGYGLMVAVTAVAAFTATRINCLTIAVLGLVGGLATPVIFEQRQFIPLCIYLVILNLGVLAVVWHRRWTLLQWVAFVGTFGLYLAALEGRWLSPILYWALGFEVVIFLIYSLGSFGFNLRAKRLATMGDLILDGLNTLLFACLVGSQLELEVGVRSVGVFVGILAFYSWLKVWVLMHRELVDQRQLQVLLFNVVAFAVAVLPLVSAVKYWAAGWSLMAVLLFGWAKRWQSVLLQILGSLLLGTAVSLVIGKALMTPFGAWEWSQFVQRGWLVWLPLSFSLLAVFVNYRVKPSKLAKRLTGQPNLEVLGTDFTAHLHFVVMVLVLGLVQVETIALWESKGLIWLLPMLSLVTLFSLLYLHLGSFKETAGGRFLARFLLGGWLLRVLFYDFGIWGFSIETQAFGQLMIEGKWLISRWFTYVPLIVFGYLFAKRVIGGVRLIPAVRLRVMAHVLLLAMVVIEIGTLGEWVVPDFKAGAVSIVLASFALFYLIWGIHRNDKSLRIWGLRIFAVLVPKVLLFDLAHTAMLWRVAAFIILGILIMAGSFFYLRERSRFEKSVK